MKSLLVFTALTLGFVVTAAVCQEVAPGVQNTQPAPGIPAGNLLPGAQTTVHRSGAPPANYFPLVQDPTGPFHVRPEHRNATRKAWQMLKQAEDDEARSGAKEELRGALEKEYDASLDAFEDHLTKLEKKIADLKDQLQRRRSAKQEMVDLKLQMMVHEADGLGWPDQPGSAYYAPWFSNPIAVPTPLTPPRKRSSSAR